MNVQGSVGDSTDILITLPCKMLCRSHDDHRAGGFLKQRISMTLRIGKADCVLGTVSDRDAFEDFYYMQLSFFSIMFIIAAFFEHVSTLKLCFFLGTRRFSDRRFGDSRSGARRFGDRRFGDRRFDDRCLRDKVAADVPATTLSPKRFCRLNVV